LPNCAYVDVARWSLLTTACALQGGRKLGTPIVRPNAFSEPLRPQKLRLQFSGDMDQDGDVRLKGAHALLGRSFMLPKRDGSPGFIPLLLIKLIGVGGEGATFVFVFHTLMNAATRAWLAFTFRPDFF
jgi:hypothetical protein